MDLIENNFVILIPFRNVKNYINNCLKSILSQKYNSYTIYLLDDSSTDGTLDAICYTDDRIKILRNEERLGPTANLFQALTTIEINKEDIILWVDGDDALYGDYTLQILNYNYNMEILLTYGQFVDSFGRIGLCCEYTREEFSNLRSTPWKASHLKTFRMSLFQSYLAVDPHGYHLKDGNQVFFMATSDIAFMFPLMEIAGFNCIKFIPNILYQYRIGPNNDHSSANGRNLQWVIECEIRNKLPINVEP